MSVSIQDIAKLRKMSGAGMMDCKNALAETNGDFDKAMEIIRKKGAAVAAKRSDRDAAEGCVFAASEGSHAAIVSVQCETDFVAKNQDTIDLTNEILALAMEKRPTSKEELLALPTADGRTVQERIIERTGQTGEKTELGAYVYLDGVSTTSYIHMNNKLATIVSFNESVDAQMGRDIAMQVAAMNPIAVLPEGISEKVIEQERTIAREKALESGKPENIVDRIVEGSLGKFFKENTLLQQEFVKDGKMSVADYLHTASKTLTVVDFKRVNLNED